MKRGLKKRSGLYGYLETQGVLDKGEIAINAAKRIYWKEYKKEWKKRKQKTCKCFEVFLNTNELSVLETAAKKHKRSVTAFVKQAALCYSTQKYLVSDVLTVNSIKELLIMILASIQKLSDESIIRYADTKEIIQHVNQLERLVLELLTTPKLLEEKIIAEVKSCLAYKEELIGLLQKL